MVWPFLVLLAPTTVTYAHPAPGTTLSMDLYGLTPTRRTVGFPAIVLIHGGSYLAGDRKMLSHEGEAFAKAGFVAASIDYRLAPKAHMDDMVADCRTAVRYLRAHAKELGLDPTRIAAYGHSAGGGLGLMLGVPDETRTKEWKGVSSRVRTIVSFAGPSDFTLPFPAYDLNQMAPALFGMPLAAAEPTMRRFSPVHEVSRDFPPTYFIQGTKDPYVPYAQSVVMYERLQASGVPTVLRTMAGEGHFPDWTKPKWTAALDDAIRFVRSELR